MTLHFLLYLNCTRICVCLVNILSTSKINLDLTLCSFCSKELSVLFIFDVLCSSVSLFYQSRKFSPTSASSSHFLCLACLLKCVERGSVEREKNRYFNGFCPTEILTAFSQEQENYSFLLLYTSQLVLRYYEAVFCMRFTV